MSNHRMLPLALLALGVAFAPLALASTTPTSTSHHSTTSSAKSHEMKVDLNTASREELMKLGIDGASADKVIAARPFKSKSELQSRHLVTEAEYKKVSGKVMVKTTTPAATAPATK